MPKPPSRLKEHSKKRAFQWLSYAGVLMIAAVAGFAMQYGPAGYVVLFVYGAVCLVLRISSTVTFLLSIIAITAVVILLFRRSLAMAGHYATYTFLLWVIGALSLGLEQRRAKKSVRGLRINNEL